MGKKKRKNRALKDLASQVIFWQKAFNQAQDELERLDNQPRLRCKIDKHQDIIDRALGKHSDDIDI